MSPDDRRELEAALQEISDVETNCGASDDPADYVIEADLADARSALGRALAREGQSDVSTQETKDG